MTALRSCALLVPPFVYCELLAAGRDAARLHEAFLRARIVLEDDVPLRVHEGAAQRHRPYLAARRGGATIDCPACRLRQTPTCASCGTALATRRLPFDFLIGAFAAEAADSHLLTRDAGNCRRDFPELILV